MADYFPMPDDDDMDYGEPPMHGPHLNKKHSAKTGRKRWLIIAAVAVVLLLAGGIIYWFMSSPKETPKSSTPTARQAEAPKPVGNKPNANATIETYKSTKLNFEFSYRSDWTFKETEDKDEIILTSPLVTYAAKDGTSKQGVFTFKMRYGEIPEAIQTAVQKAVAVKDSEVIAYAKPTDAQRHYTNLSYGGPDAKSFGFVIVTGSVAYKAGQTFGPQVDLQGTAYLFAGGYGADTSDALDFEPVPATAFDSVAYQQVLDIIESLKIY